MTAAARYLTHLREAWNHSYARADEIGVPYCITVDYDTLDEKSDKHGTVTVRFRNDGKQIRVKIGELSSKIAHFVKEGKVRDD